MVVGNFSVWAGLGLTRFIEDFQWQRSLVEVGLLCRGADFSKTSSSLGFGTSFSEVVLSSVLSCSIVFT